MAVFDDTKEWAYKLLVYPHKISWENNLPVPIKAKPDFIEMPPDEPLKLECQHFLHCISNGSRPLTDGSEGLQVLKVLKASQYSLERNGQRTALNSEADVQAIPFSEPKSRRNVFVHKTAIIDDQVQIGDGTKIWHFSHILSGSKIGSSCNFGQNVVIGPDVNIGNECKIQNNVSVYKGVTLEDGVFCGPSMVFTNIYNPRAEIRKMDQVRPTLVRKGATIGANATIICGSTLGKYCFVGAGAVVNHNIPDHALVVGNPAKQIGWACQCGERLTHDLKCQTCQRRYNQTDEGLVTFD